MNTYPMSPADAAWFHNDGPANLAIVMGVVLTQRPLDFKKVRKLYLERLMSFDRFRQRVVETGFPLPRRAGRTCRTSTSISTCTTSRWQHRTTRPP